MVSDPTAQEVIAQVAAALHIEDELHESLTVDDLVGGAADLHEDYLDLLKDYSTLLSKARAVVEAWDADGGALRVMSLIAELRAVLGGAR